MFVCNCHTAEYLNGWMTLLYQSSFLNLIVRYTLFKWTTRSPEHLRNICTWPLINLDQKSDSAWITGPTHYHSNHLIQLWITMHLSTTQPFFCCQNYVFTHLWDRPANSAFHWRWKAEYPWNRVLVGLLLWYCGSQHGISGHKKEANLGKGQRGWFLQPYHSFAIPSHQFPFSEIEKHS